jgi:hypothetical protein
MRDTALAAKQLYVVGVLALGRTLNSGSSQESVKSVLLGLFSEAQKVDITFCTHPHMWVEAFCR